MRDIMGVPLSVNDPVIVTNSDGTLGMGVVATITETVCEVRKVDEMELFKGPSKQLFILDKTRLKPEEEKQKLLLDWIEHPPGSSV